MTAGYDRSPSHYRGYRHELDVRDMNRRERQSRESESRRRLARELAADVRRPLIPRAERHW